MRSECARFHAAAKDMPALCVCVCVLLRFICIFAILFLLTPAKTVEAVCRRLSLSLSLCVWACPAADESTFAFTQVTKHKRNETERKSQTKRAQVKQKPQWRHGRRERSEGTAGKNPTQFDTSMGCLSRRQLPQLPD